MTSRTPALITIAAAITVALSGCGTSASYSTKVLGYLATDSAHLEVFVQVSNTGSSAGTPTCLIQGNTPDMSGIGTDSVTLEGTLQPGKSAKFTDTFVITDQDAASVNHVTVSCN
jgi:hypothetical protein